MTEEGQWILDQFPPDYKGWVIEVGAYDGVEGSHVEPLEQLGWETLAIEPNPVCEPSLKLFRKRYWMGACDAVGITGKHTFHRNTSGPQGWSSLRPNKDHPVWKCPADSVWDEVQVEVRSLEYLLALFAVPRVDALVIDTEGTELDVLKGVELHTWKPKALVIESWDEQGAIVPYLADHGYRRIQRLGVNDCYRRVER